MRSRHLFGYLAESIALVRHLPGCPLRQFTARAGTKNSFRQQHSKTSAPASLNTFSLHSSSTSASARSSARRHVESSANGVLKDADAAAAKSLPERARQILRHVADSVVVCTVHSRDAAPATDAVSAVPVGLTMSSFTSLSLYPTPVVTFNIAMPSRTEAAIAKARHFMIHILSGNAKGARVADVFRAGNAHPSATLLALQRSGSKTVWPSRAPEPQPDSEQPYLQGPGVLCVLRCRLLEEPMQGLVPVRDHVVVLAEVLEIISGEADATDSVGAPRFGLVYGDRHYRQLSGSVIRTSSE